MDFWLGSLLITDEKKLNFENFQKKIATSFKRTKITYNKCFLLLPSHKMMMMMIFTSINSILKWEKKRKFSNQTKFPWILNVQTDRILYKNNHAAVIVCCCCSSSGRSSGNRIIFLTHANFFSLFFFITITITTTEDCQKAVSVCSQNSVEQFMCIFLSFIHFGVMEQSIGSIIYIFHLNLNLHHRLSTNYYQAFITPKIISRGFFMNQFLISFLLWGWLDQCDKKNKKHRKSIPEQKTNSFNENDSPK